MSDSMSLGIGVDVGQTMPLVPGLRSLVTAYPAGFGVIKEFLQNADDAGASYLRVILDLRDHAGPDIPEPMRQLMGPALVFQSDQVFRPEDLESIRTIAQGSKRDDVNSTGQFGKGFNTAYSVSDYPGFVTGDLLWIFDPLNSVVSKSSGGWQCSLSDVAERYPSLLRAFGLIGYQGRALRHTSFRLPLRTASQTGRERLSTKSFSIDEARQILHEGRDFGEAILLFLRSVHCLTACEIDRQGGEHLHFAIRTTDPAEVKANRRALAIDGSKSALEIADFWHAHPEECPWRAYEHRCVVETGAMDDRPEGKKEVTWLVAQGYELGPRNELLKLVRDMDEIGQTALPLVGAAICIESAIRAGQPTPCDGSWFCMLPLPARSSLPFHVNGSFALDPARAKPLERGVGDGAVRAAWNRGLAQLSIPVIVNRLFGYLLASSSELEPHSFYALWPQTGDAGALRSDVAKGATRLLADTACIRVRAGEATRWLPTDRAFRRGANWGLSLSEALAQDGLELIDPPLPGPVVEWLRHHDRLPQRCSPGRLASWLSTQEVVPTPVDRAPLSCLRRPDFVRRILEDLAPHPEVTLGGLPLSLRANSFLDVFTSDREVFVDGKDLQVLVPQLQGFCVDRALAKPLERRAELAGDMPGVAILQAADLHLALRVLHRNASESTGEAWPVSQGDLDGWLSSVLRHLAAHRPSKPADDLAGLPLVQCTRGALHPAFRPETPAFPPQSLSSEHRRALTFFGVAVIGGSEAYRGAWRSLNEAYRGAWRSLNSVCTGLPAVPSLAEAIVHGLADSGVVTAELQLRLLLLDLLVSTARPDSFSPRIRKLLVEAPIWPTSGGALHAVDAGDVYVPVGFQPPISSGAIFFQTGGSEHFARFLIELGAEPYGVEAFVRRVFLEQFGEFEETDRLDALNWLSEEWESVAASSDHTLLGRLRQASIAPTSDGAWVVPGTLYFPDAEVARKVLAKRARTLRFAPRAGGAWRGLFAKLGVRRSPWAVDLVLRLTDLIALAEESGAEAIESALRPWAEHVAHDWQALREVSIDGKAFVSRLKELKWLPIRRDSDAEREWGVLARHPDRLFSPAEVFHSRCGFRVASQEPICGLDSDAVEVVLKEVGVRYDVPVSVARKHFVAVRDAWRNGAVDSMVVGRTARSFYKMIGETLTSRSESALLREVGDLRETAPVIWVEDWQQFVRPAHVFKCEVDGFLGLRVRIPDEGDIGRGLSWLGRRENAAIEDYASYLDDVSAAVGESKLEGAQLESALWALNHIVALSPGYDELASSVCVPDEVCRLRPARLVLEDDASWWRDRVRADDSPVILVHPRVSRAVVKVTNIAPISATVREILSRLDEPSDPAISELCDWFHARLAHPQFELGLRRLIHDVHGDTVHALHVDVESVFHLQITPCENLLTHLSGAPSDPSRSFGEKRVDVFLDQINTAVYVASGEPDVVRPQVASAINRLLKEASDPGLALNDLAPLEEILRVDDPEAIAIALDRRRVASFSVADEASEDEPRMHEGPRSFPEVEGEIGEASLRATSDGSGRGEAGNWVEGQPSHPPVTPESRLRSEVGAGGQGTTSERTPVSPFDREGSGEWPIRGERGSSSGGLLTPAGDGRSGSPSSTAQRLRTYIVPARPGSKGDAGATVMHKEAVNRSAIGAVRNYEARSGVAPDRLKEMHHLHPGYDMQRLDDSGGVVRYIEVKGTAAEWSRTGVSLTRTQVETAREHTDAYWVYVVEFALDPDQVRVYAIQNPVVRVSEFFLDDGWRALAEPSPSNRRLEPAPGLRLFSGELLLGVVTRVHGTPGAGTPVRLEIEKPDGTPDRLTWSRRSHRLEEMS